MEQKIGVGIGVMLLRDGKILLGKRHEDPEKASSLLKGAGTWTMPGGKMHFQESFEEGAAREVEEETGIKLNKSKVICVNNDKIEGVHFVTIGLFSDDFSGQPEVKEPDEITEWKWFSLDTLPSPLYFPSAKVLDNYKNKAFYIKDAKPTREFLSTVYIVRDGKVLLTFNKKVGKFIPLGGHIEKDELPCYSAVREAKEESGFDIELINAKNFDNQNLVQNLNIQLDVIKPDHHHINLSYTGKIIGGEQLEKSDEDTELRWFSPEDIKNSTEIFDNTKELSLKAIEIIKNI
jgi:8-oxo-dGTP diphosphatase